MNLKNRIFLHFLQTYQKKKEVPFLEMSRDNVQKGENLLIWKCHETMTKAHAYISYEVQLQNHSLNFIHKNKSLLSATSIQSCSPMVYNTTASLDKITYTDYLDFGKCQDRFESLSWTKNDSNYLDIKLKVFEREDKIAEFRLR